MGVARLQALQQGQRRQARQQENPQPGLGGGEVGQSRAPPRDLPGERRSQSQTWGPLADDGRPCPQRKGQTFALWKKQLQNLGYQVEHRELRACDYGAPTIRKRLFLVAR